MGLKRNMYSLVIILTGCLVVGMGVRSGQRTVFAQYAALKDTIKTEQRHTLFRLEQRKRKTVALTFDDGPKADTTEWLLEQLAVRNIKSTFFLIGSQAEMEENTSVIRRMYEDGHQIGCHTYSHVEMTTLSETEQKQEITEWYRVVSGIIGDFSYCIRPPYGSVNNKVCTCMDIPVILWSVDTLDWTGKGAEEIADYIVSEVEDGDIILLHDIFDESVRGAVAAADRLQQQGYDFVTVDELLTAKGIKEEGGKVYRKAQER